MIRFTLAFIALTTYASAQSSTISGLVFDGSSGVPLVGATVTLEDSGQQVKTDFKGCYSFSDPTTTKVVPASQTRFGQDASNADQAKPLKETSSHVIIFSKEGYGTVTRQIKSTNGTENVVLTLEGKVTYVCSTADSKGRWQIARTVYDPETRKSAITYFTDSTEWNFKPNFSPDGSKMTFFRRYAADGPCCGSWLSSVCVMNADGTNLHEIITGEDSFNTEPYWSRDGSMRISFNRMNVKEAGPYWNAFDGQPGAEQKIGPWGWVNPHLSDGRVFIQRGAIAMLQRLPAKVKPNT